MPSPLFHNPTLPYSGLTFILSHPSRFDNDQLISGYISKYFSQCLAPFSRFNCCIQLLSCNNKPLLEGTKVVVLLGSEAQRHYIPSITLNEARGNVYNLGGIYYIATYLPQDCSDRVNYESQNEEDDEADDKKDKDLSPTRRKNFRFWFYHDIKKAIKIIHNEAFNINNLSYIYPTSTDIFKFLDSLKDQDLFLDIETNSRYNITVLSLATKDSKVYTIPFLRYTEGPAYDYLTLCKILCSISRAFQHNTVIIHNAMFDLFILLWRYKIHPPLKVKDTMLMHHRLFPEVEKSLGHCISLYLFEPFHKGTGIYEPKTQQQETQLFLYNNKDVATLRAVYYEIEKMAKDNDLLRSMDRVNSFILPYLLLTFQGCAIDSKFKVEYLNEIERKQIQYLRILKILIGYDIEKISPKRVITYLYEYLKIPKPNKKINKDGNITYEDLTASGTLLNLLLTYKIPAIKVILAYRQLGKKAGFLKFNTFNNRFTTSIKIAGTNTFRTASSKLFDTWGGNSQNIEKELRKVICADEGKVLVQTDQSGAEALVVAYLSPPGNYRRLFENNIKIHNYVSLHLFQLIWENKLGKKLDHLINAPIESLKDIKDWKEVEALSKASDDWPAEQRYYYLAKKTCHMSNYGAGVNKFIMEILKDSDGQISLNKTQAQYFLNKYFTLFPEILQWHHLIRQELTLNRCLYNLFGDRRLFSSYWDDNLFRESYAFIPQSTVGVLTSVAITELQSYIEKYNLNWDVLLNCHDAIVAQCPENEAKDMAIKQQEFLAKNFTTRYGSFTMKSESSVGKNWYEMTKI